jgi:hypothetical protein
MKIGDVLERFDRVMRWRFLVIVPLAFLYLFMWISVGSKPAAPLFNHGTQYDNATGVVDLGAQPDLCGALKSPNGYFLISGLIEDLPASGSFGFLQTDEKEIGLFFDFDQLPRIGLALANGSMSYTSIDPGNKPIKREDRLAFIIFLSADGTLKYYENKNLAQVSLTDPSPKCESFQIGRGNESGPYPGRISVAISAGTDIAVAEDLLIQYESQFASSSVRLYNWSKTGLVIALVLLIVGNPFVMRKSKRASDELELS